MSRRCVLSPNFLFPQQDRLQYESSWQEEHRRRLDELALIKATRENQSSEIIRQVESSQSELSSQKVTAKNSTTSEWSHDAFLELEEEEKKQNLPIVRKGRGHTDAIVGGRSRKYVPSSRVPVPAASSPISPIPISSPVTSSAKRNLPSRAIYKPRKCSTDILELKMGQMTLSTPSSSLPVNHSSSANGASLPPSLINVDERQQRFPQSSAADDALINPLFILDVDGIPLSIYAGDTPRMVAVAHCTKHNIAHFSDVLTTLIETNMSERA